MTKQIETVTEDIYQVLDATQDHEHDSALAAEYAMRIGGEFAKATVKRDAPREKGKLWASDLGKPCMRQHWYNFNGNPTKEALDGHTKFKFLYGNILEEAVLYFAEEGGHAVGELQARVEYPVNPEWTVSGRIDAVVDGVLIDVKTTSTYGFKRYKDGITPLNDSFGYLYQLGFYKEFNELGLVSEEAGFLWIDKGNGHIKYTPATTPTREELINRADDIIEAVDKQEQDVEKHYVPQPYGKSGNMSLPISCAYCAHKVQCWRDSNNGKGLRGFYYNQGPVWFTDVTRLPKTPEIKL
jgi:hypothetical protein